MYIYVITNKVNFKAYVGQTIQTPNSRWIQHKTNARNRLDLGGIYDAIRKYGIENFSFTVIDECTSTDELNEAEKRWIKTLGTYGHTGYNLQTGGVNSKYSQKSKEKMSASQRARNRTSDGKRKPVSMETRERMRQAKTGKKYPNRKTPPKLTEEHKRNIGLGQKGRKHSLETRKNLSQKLRNRAKKVCQCSTTGDIIAIHNSVYDASDITGISRFAIADSCLQRGQMTGAGYLWISFDNALEQPPHQEILERVNGYANRKRGKPKKSVLQITKDGDVVAYFESLYRASIETNIARSNITDVCSPTTTRRYAGGYVWKYGITI